MELWEFNACVRSYAECEHQRQRNDFYRDHRVAAFVGQAFGGKLKKASHYLRDTHTEQTGQALTREDMDEFDRRYAERKGGIECRLKT